ncbi:hypothetical protein BV22DRAFT_1107578 [Leucogyrophana mollusca]|uniref:Uncharacterized protein n=1 Tax=Leucogyrophana mollusca TaxID=85980 RepID=A0ACB8B4R1_9AGAM|nr:hypothetical protein BV22DRAFT_1107578 [Leucogyrophana mollusca]
MVRCPGCSKRFKDERAITRHLSQPRTSCLGWTDELVRIADAMDISALIPPVPHPGHDLNASDYPMELDDGLEEYVGAGRVYLDEREDAQKEEFAGAAEILGEGRTYLDVFDYDEFAEERKANLYYPFASRGDWKMASFLLRSGLSMAAIDELLALDLIRQLPISYRTAKELRGRCEMLPKGPRWSCRPITTDHPTKSSLRLFWRDPVECLEALFSNPIFNGKIDFVPRRVYRTAAHLVRVYNEWMSGDAAWNFQSALPAGATVLGTILSSDKTTISTMTGDRVAHPLLVGLANIHMSTRSKLSSNAFMLTALLPVAKFLHPTKRMRGVLQDRLVHKCLDLVLQPLKIAAAVGIMMSDPVGNIRYCFTPLAAYIVDTPEACKTSPFTMATFKHAFFLACEPHRLNGVVEPFWRDYSLAEPTIFFPPEPLHHWFKAFWDHDAQWCIVAVGPEEIDFRFSVLQPTAGFRHFKDGISKLKQVTGRTHRDVQRYIVGVSAGAVPQGVITAVRALMDFRYLAQAPSIGEDDCEKILAALREFHDHKQAVVDAGARRGAKKGIKNWYIPKLELMQSVVPSIRQVGATIQWSADVTEHAHVTEIKDPARRSNNNDYDPQICRHLDREEKRRRFDLVTSLKEKRWESEITSDPDASDDDAEGDGGDEERPNASPSAVVSSDGPRAVTNYFAKAKLLLQAPQNSVPTPLRSFIANSTAVGLAYDPSIRRMLVDDVADKFHLPDLRGALSDYLQRENRLKGALHTIGGSRRASGPCPLPFDHLQVWYKVRLQQMSYHARDQILPAQTVNAAPPNSEWEHGRYDTVLVHTDDNYKWPDSGLFGRHVSSEDNVLVYVERFDVVSQPDGGQVDQATQMHVLKRALRSNGLPMGDVIPLKQLRSYINLIPRFGASADVRLKKSNVMKYSSIFYLNKYFDKEIYYALSYSH